MSKLKYIEKKEMLGIKYAHLRVYGYIADRKVDDYNGPIKVFVPIYQDGYTEYYNGFDRGARNLGGEILREPPYQHLDKLVLFDASKRMEKKITKKIQEYVKEETRKLADTSAFATEAMLALS